MQKYLVKFKSGGRILSESVVAPDLGTAIERFAKLRQTVEKTEILSIEPQPVTQKELSSERDSDHPGELEEGFEANAIINSRHRTEKEETREVWSLSNSKVLRYRNRITLLTIAIFAMGIFLYSSLTDKSNPEMDAVSNNTSLRSKSQPEEPQSPGPYCKSILNERSFDDIFVNYDLASDSARYGDDYIIPGTRHKIHYREDAERFTEQISPNIKKATVSEIGHKSTAIIYEVQCERESIQLESVSDGEKRFYACYDGNTVVFWAAASICLLR